MTKTKIFNGRQYRKKSFWLIKSDAQKQVKLHHRIGDLATAVRELGEVIVKGKEIEKMGYAVYVRRGSTTPSNLISKRIDGKVHLGTGKRFSSKVDVDRVADDMRDRGFNARVIPEKYKGKKKYQIFFRRG